MKVTEFLYRSPYVSILLLSVAISLFLIATRRHARAGIFNYHSQVWADQSGYYVYLPLVFYYHMDANQMASDIEDRVGHGFSRHGKIVKTKYLSGVALLQSPFFLITYVLCHEKHSYRGFSLPYHLMIDAAAVTYGLLGLLLLYKFLRRYVKNKIALITTLSIYGTTPLLYYTLVYTGMSHAYSFFLFSAFLYLAKENPFSRLKTSLLLGLVTGLIIVVRPINVVFLPIFFFLCRIRASELIQNLKNLLAAMTTAFCVFIPQMLYWKYAYGNFLVYSYAGEGFTNWPPKLLHILFAPKNSLFVYAPLTLLALWGVYYLRCIFSVKLLIWVYFLCVAGLFSAWHAWHYGCSYGSRPFVEYMSILSLPLAHFFEKVETRKWTRYATLSFVTLTAAYSIKLTFSYDMCWYWGDWDWKALFYLLTKPTW
ncbi:MAG: hypothetical protein ACUVRD_03070 [Bacteroidia bacterium]